MSTQRPLSVKPASWRFLLPCVVSVLMLSICTKSSPLYPMNDWVDVHCFFTVGRGIRHGMIPYLDLYEQKGPLIYFLYALAALISENSFLGVFLIEVLCFAVFLHYSGRTAEVLADTPWAYPITVAAMGLIIPITPAFSHGGSAEELMLPVLAGGLYIAVRAMTESRLIRPGEGLLLGALTAAAFWSKYTFCGLFAGLAVGVIVLYFVRRQGRDLLRLIGFFLLGLLIPTVPLILWFAAHGALPAMWDAYILNNLSLYSQNIRGGQYDPPLLNLLNNLPWSIPAVAGLVCAYFRKNHRIDALVLSLGAAGLFIFTYLNGRRYPYYALVLSVFAPLGFGYAFSLLQNPAEKHRSAAKRIALSLTAVIMLASPFAAYKLSRNTYLLGTPREDMPPYRFAALIAQTEDRSLLNSGFLDGGFYYAAGVLPDSPYFCTLNISLPEMEEALSRSVRDGETAYVITRQRPLKETAPYHLIDECSFPFEGRSWTYYLYRRNDLDG